MEGVQVILQETIHELHRKKQSRVIHKLDFEKAYDKVSWPIFPISLKVKTKGFSPVWWSWIEYIVSQGSVGIKVNDNIGHYFQTKKGLRQCDLRAISCTC